MGAGVSRSKSRYYLTTQDIINECDRDKRITHMNILVTGATSGIGLETGRALACAGANVYLMGRDETKLERILKSINNELQQQQQYTGSVQGVICDLNSLVSVKQFAENFIKKNLPLNILILNAGVINFNYEKLNRMNGNNTDAKKEWSMMCSYQQSKLANVLFARALTSRYRDKQVTDYSLHPGVIKTSLDSKIPLAIFLKTFLKTKTITQGAATTVYCTVKSGLEKESGRYFVDSPVTDIADKWTNEDLNIFWEWTETVIRQRTTDL